MRRYKDTHKKGDTRIKTWFALMPVRAGGEERWLEWVTVEQECRYFDGEAFTWDWYNVRFID